VNADSYEWFASVAYYCRKCDKEYEAPEDGDDVVPQHLKKISVKGNTEDYLSY
jgi:hypothetical protein